MVEILYRNRGYKCDCYGKIADSQQWWRYCIGIGGINVTVMGRLLIVSYGGDTV